MIQEPYRTLAAALPLDLLACRETLRRAERRLSRLGTLGGVSEAMAVGLEVRKLRLRLSRATTRLSAAIWDAEEGPDDFTLDNELPLVPDDDEANPAGTSGSSLLRFPVPAEARPA